MKLRIKAFFLLIVFLITSCSNINFNITKQKIKGVDESKLPSLIESKLPTDSFLKLETYITDYSPNQKPISKLVSSCSGFSIGHNSKGTVGITNNHCVTPNLMIVVSLLTNQNAQLEYTVRTPTNKSYLIKVLKRDKESDLASFLIPSKYLPYSKISHREPAIGESVWIISSPLGFDTFYDKLNTVPIIYGIFNGLIKTARLGDKVSYMYNAKIAPGSSGSGVYIRTGKTYELIGVVHSLIALQGSYREFCIGTTRSDLITFVNKHKFR